MSTSEDEKPPPRRTPSVLADFYRRKADECVRSAETAGDPESREHWIKLANGWTVMAVATARQAPDSDEAGGGA